MPGEALAWLQHAVWGGRRAAISPPCFLTTRRSSVSAGAHWPAVTHWVSVTHEKKLGQFLMMVLIIGFCSVLNKGHTSHKPEGWSCSHARVHTHTTGKRKKTDAKTSYVFLTAQVKIKFQEITIDVKEIMVQNFFCRNHLIQVKTKSYRTCH